MESSSRICKVCGTVNPLNSINCLACGQVLLETDNTRALASAPTTFLPTNKLLKQRYRVIHVIGRGGMGTVYIGRDLQLGNRLVAIKEMIQDGLSQAERMEAARNFKREAHLLAGLQHPHLPSIYDHFEEDQRWYLVMSFVKGQTLTEYLRAKHGRLPVGEVIEIGIALCSVLHYLHTNNPPIVFRDLKPSNIMRTVDGHIYLIDFGIARLFKAGQTKDTTNHGTSGYASPEQYGMTQTTPRSDIYSLGATLYQLLSGYEPANTPFLLPPLQWYAPNAPTALVTLITQMLDLDEQQRPQNVDVVKQELHNIAHSFSSTFPLSPSAQTPGPEALPLAITPLQLRDPDATPRSLTPAHLHDRDALPPPLTPARLPGLDATSRPLTPTRKKRWWLFPGIATSIVVVSAMTYFILLNTNTLNTSASYKVVNTFCEAMNSQAPDFQIAYAQFSRNYQSKHSLVDFQEYLQGTIQCAIASAPNKNNQAGLNVTFSCPHGPPPAGNRPPPPPGPNGFPPSRNPINLVLVDQGGNDWKIDSIYIVGSICGLPPDLTPPQPDSQP